MRGGGGEEGTRRAKKGTTQTTKTPTDDPLFLPFFLPVYQLAALLKSGATTWDALDLDDVDVRLKWVGLFHRRKRTPGKVSGMKKKGGERGEGACVSVARAASAVGGSLGQGRGRGMGACIDVFFVDPIKTCQTCQNTHTPAAPFHPSCPCTVCALARACADVCGSASTRRAGGGGAHCFELDMSHLLSFFSSPLSL